MRVQLEGQSLRLRIDEAELANLLAGGVAENRTRLPDGRVETQQLRLAAQLAWKREDAVWQIDLPAAEVRALSERLPSREGLHFDVAGRDGVVLPVMFDVDVRDSTRKRMHKSNDGGVA